MGGGGRDYGAEERRDVTPMMKREKWSYRALLVEESESLLELGSQDLWRRVLHQELCAELPRNRFSQSRLCIKLAACRGTKPLYTLQKHNTENSKQIFPKKVLRGLSPNFHILCQWAIYIFPQSVYLFCCRKICGPILWIYKSLTDKWMWIGTEAAQFLCWEYINGIFVAV